MTEIEMEKATKENLHTVQFSDSTSRIMERAFSSTNPIEALKLLAKCLKGKAVLRCETIKYSSSTGKPIRYAWKPFEKWDGCLWLNCFSNWPSLDKDSPIYKPLLKFLPVGKTAIIVDGDEKYVVQHVRAVSSGDDMHGGTTPSHLVFAKAL